VVSAPSGAGKTTLCRRLVEKMPGLEFSVSYTTRPPRPGEVNDRDYTFVGRDEFMEMVRRGEFAEWAEVHGNFYGTSRGRLREMLDRGVDVMMDIDVQGAGQIREAFADGVFIFVLPPSWNALVERLDTRKTDPPDVVKGRLSNAVEEIREYSRYNYVIVNDMLDEALRELEAVVISEGLLTGKMDPSWVEDNFFRQEEG
jgi:guanylate kinase